MIESNRWILAVAVASGFLMGEIAGRIIHGSMTTDPTRSGGWRGP